MFSTGRGLMSMGGDLTYASHVLIYAAIARGPSGNGFALTAIERSYSALLIFTDLDS